VTEGHEGVWVSGSPQHCRDGVVFEFSRKKIRVLCIFIAKYCSWPETGTEVLNNPHTLGSEGAKRTGVENLAGGVQFPNPPSVNSHPVFISFNS